MHIPSRLRMLVPGGPDGGGVPALLIVDEVGALWRRTIAKHNKTVTMTAAMPRHVDLLPGGPGGGATSAAHPGRGGRRPGRDQPAPRCEPAQGAHSGQRIVHRV